MVVETSKRTGRPTIFPKTGPDVHGRISEEAGAVFFAARETVARLTGWEIWKVSDGDVIEYLCHGKSHARKVLAERNLLKGRKR